MKIHLFDGVQRQAALVVHQSRNTIKNLSNKQARAIIILLILLIMAILFLILILALPASSASPERLYHTNNAFAETVALETADEDFAFTAGRDEHYNSTYDENGLPMGRKFLTLKEYKAEHVRGKQREQFVNWRDAYKAEQLELAVKALVDVAKQRNAPQAVVVIATAQFILESAYGTSKIACVGNNFYGHKWTEAAEGKKGVLGFISANDDAKYDKFRHYETAWYSHYNHMDILLNRYAEQVNDVTDVKSWTCGLCALKNGKHVKGLQYATGCNRAKPKSEYYDEKLLRVIEQNNIRELVKKHW